MSVQLDLTVISNQPLTLANSKITSTVIINKRPELWLKPLYVCAISGGSFAALCNPKSSNRRCCLPADPGLCMGYFPRFFFNATSEQCEEFIYGGCGGNENNFEKEGDCKASCRPGKENRALLFIKDWRKETLALTTIYFSIFLSVVLDIASPAPCGGDCKASCKPGKENRALLFIKHWRKETLALTTIYCSIFLSVVLDIASPAPI